MDDKSFLRNFELNSEMVKKSSANLQFLKFPASSKTDCTIFIFTQTDNARIFFLNSNYSDLFSQQNIFVFQNEDIIPAGAFQSTDKVYLLSISNECGHPVKTDDQAAPSWTSGLVAALYRIFIFDVWDYLKKDYFVLPTIISDNDFVSKIVASFVDNHLEKYRNFFRIINRLRRESGEKRIGKNILIYAMEDDGVLESLYCNFRRKGRNVFLVNYQLHWIPDVGWDSDQDNNFMSDVDFAEYLIENDIHHVIFRNYYDMELGKYDNVNKIWIMRELGISAISLFVDTIIEFPFVRFKFMQWLPDNVKVINASSTESYDAFSKWLGVKKVHKCPQIVEFSRTGTNVLKNRKEKPEGVVVASNSRLYLLSEMPELSTLIIPLAREIVLNRVKIYNAYFPFIEAIAKADKLFGSEEMTLFYWFVGRFTLTFRSLIRYSLIDRMAILSDEIGVPFRIFGSEDWRMLFRNAYVQKYLNKEELHQVYQKNIVLIPTPSTTFESQHPSITRALLLGRRVIAPKPFFGAQDRQISSLKRFYFSVAEEMGETLSQVIKGEGITLEEREALLDRFGVECLGDLVQDIIDGNENHDWDRIPGAEKAMLLLDDEDRKVISAFSNYILILFKVLFGKNSGTLRRTRSYLKSYFLNRVREECSNFLSQEVEELMISKDRYIRKLGEEKDVLEKILQAIS